MDSHGAEPGLRRSLRAAVTLAVAVGLAVLALTLVREATRTRVEASERARRAAAFELLLGGVRHDNELFADRIEVHDPELLGTDEPVPVYRARLEGRPIAAILEAVAPDGYSGSIRIAMAVTPDGRLLGVRVIEHHETPGLGDAIEEHRSDWVRQFDGRSLEDPPPAAWAVRKDGGAFDQLTGATVTPRAVVAAVRNALLFVQRSGAGLYAPAPAQATGSSRPPR
jgi:Na+-translocating ferredoxin:NAD+ oxidoreductase subunit G